MQLLVSARAAKYTVVHTCTPTVRTRIIEVAHYDLICIAPPAMPESWQWPL
jgi:hypothetical protein